MLWSLVLFYGTCTVDPFHFYLSSFHFHTHARYRDLLMMDFHFRSPKYTISKICHFLGFFIFDILLVRWLHRPWLTLLIAICFGVTTEIFQLYFGRDGRLYDMVIDSGGAVLSFWLQRLAGRRYAR